MLRPPVPLPDNVLARRHHGSIVLGLRHDKATAAAALQEARRRTWLLVDGLDDERLQRAPCEYLSPPAWDLGHMANFEELWLVQRLLSCAEMRPGYNDTYDAFRHPRPERPMLRLLDRQGLRQYQDEVRQRALAALEACDLDTQRLTRRGFVHWMIVLHEHQHQETLLQALQMMDRYDPPPARPLPRPGSAQVRAGAHEAPPAAVQEAEPSGAGQMWQHVHGGPFVMGVPPGPGVYDNESPAHVVDVGPFDIATHPVTCGDYLRFMEDGGYEQARWWSRRGRRWLDEEEHHAPLYWLHDGQWQRRTLAGRRPVADAAQEILCHVTQFEAEAYAAWAGARLPTEQEWEKACRHAAGAAKAGPAPTMEGAPQEDTGATAPVAHLPVRQAPVAAVGPSPVCPPPAQRPGEVDGVVCGPRNPWGDAPATAHLANIDQLGLQPSCVGAYPAGASPCGAQHMIGDVWEWTSSSFEAYPGFEAYPYKEYSEVFFGGDYRVLRGGSWATRAGCANGTFRNWDHPYRRQIFAGIRLARDA